MLKPYCIHLICFFLPYNRQNIYLRLVFRSVANFGKAVSGVLSGLYPLLETNQKQHLCYVQVRPPGSILTIEQRN